MNLFDVVRRGGDSAVAGIRNAGKNTGPKTKEAGRWGAL